MVLGSGYTAAEDEVLARAWLVASGDPVVGTKQSGESYFNAVHENYEQIRPRNRDARSVESVKCRLKTLLKEVTKFSGYY